MQEHTRVFDCLFVMVKRREEQRGKTRQPQNVKSYITEDCTLLTLLHRSEVECDDGRDGEVEAALSCEKGVNVKMKKLELVLKWLE